MKLVIDANIVISAALNIEGKTREIIFLENIELLAPDFLLSELNEHKLELIEKSVVSEEELNLAIYTILSKVRLIYYSEFNSFLEKAKKICPDPDDEEYFALSLSLDIPIWSNDKDLKEQNVVKVISTKELIEMLGK